MAESAKCAQDGEHRSRNEKGVLEPGGLNVERVRQPFRGDALLRLGSRARGMLAIVWSLRLRIGGGSSSADNPQGRSAAH